MDGWSMSDEETMVEELAAALAGGVFDSIKEHAHETTDDAFIKLGADDGMEVELPGKLSNPMIAGEIVADALLQRPELRNALVSLSNTLLERLKAGE